jgi:regulator of RNase E activity RraB
MRHFRRLAGGQPDRSPADDDRQVLGALEDAGADLARPREIRHYLYFDSERSAREGARHVASNDRTIEVRPGADGRTWLVLVTHEGIADPEAIAALREELQTAAASHDGEYDGWEAAATP